MSKPRLLWVGDAGCPSGFAVATHQTLAGLVDQYEIGVLGINYRGDPHDYPYKIWAAAPGGDALGIQRLIFMCDVFKPDIIIIQNDPWNIPHYMKRLKAKKADGSFAWPEYAAIPVIGAIAVDGLNCDGKALNDLDFAIFWTEYGQDQAVLGGYTGPSAVIPLGVDRTVYFPQDKLTCRASIMPPELDDKFVIGCVNRNQFRKRLDLTIRYYAQWVKQYKVKDANLVLHCCPTGESAFDIPRLADYYGVRSQITMVKTEDWYGVSLEDLAMFYNCLDLMITTSQGEGFSLPTIEAMACGVPLVAGKHSAIGEWAKDAAWLVPSTPGSAMWPYSSVIGSVPDEAPFIQAIQRLYIDKHARETNSKAALERASLRKFEWSSISEGFAKVLEHVLAPAEQEVAG